MVSTHVDDFNMAGNNDLVSMVTEKIRAALDISKIEDRLFRFTGIDVEQKDDSIVISMNEYAKSIEEVKVREDRSDEKLSREEMKILRKYVGKQNIPRSQAKL